uniref:Uncharacterized protein n=1 Tax=Cacopsylla melanoneura TaxID=428564 RepID=A0A8D8ZCD2_9HEMI
MVNFWSCRPRSKVRLIWTTGRNIVFFILIGRIVSVERVQDKNLARYLSSGLNGAKGIRYQEIASDENEREDYEPDEYERDDEYNSNSEMRQDESCGRCLSFLKDDVEISRKSKTQGKSRNSIQNLETQDNTISKGQQKFKSPIIRRNSKLASARKLKKFCLWKPLGAKTSPENVDEYDVPQNNDENMLEPAVLVKTHCGEGNVKNSRVHRVRIADEFRVIPVGENKRSLLSAKRIRDGYSVIKSKKKENYPRKMSEIDHDIADLVGHRWNKHTDFDRYYERAKLKLEYDKKIFRIPKKNVSALLNLKHETQTKAIPPIAVVQRETLWKLNQQGNDILDNNTRDKNPIRNELFDKGLKGNEKSGKQLRQGDKLFGQISKGNNILEKENVLNKGKHIFDSCLNTSSAPVPVYGRKHEDHFCRFNFLLLLLMLASITSLSYWIYWKLWPRKRNPDEVELLFRKVAFDNESGPSKETHLYPLSIEKQRQCEDSSYESYGSFTGDHYDSEAGGSTRTTLNLIRDQVDLSNITLCKNCQLYRFKLT